MAHLAIGIQQFTRHLLFFSLLVLFESRFLPLVARLHPPHTYFPFMQKESSCFSLSLVSTLFCRLVDLYSPFLCAPTAIQSKHL